jgi:hypothetical protein
MKKDMRLFLVLSIVPAFLVKTGFAQNVGIGNTSPLSSLQVTNGSVVFNHTLTAFPASPGTALVQGAGVRMVWFPNRAAFRAGAVDNGELNGNPPTSGSTFWDADSLGRFSAAFGYRTRATGFNTFATGELSWARGYAAVAMGNGARAMGNVSFAANGGSAEGDVSFAVNSGRAVGLSSFAAGLGTIASGSRSVALGFGTQSNGSQSFAMGMDTRADGQASVAMGQFSQARGIQSVAFGTATIAKSASAFVVGQYNDTTDMPISDFNISPTNRLFQIGNGDGGTGVRSNAMTVLQNGNIGIGTTTPNASLHMAGSLLATGDPFFYDLTASPPAEGNGIRLLWFHQRAALRAGLVSGNQWNRDSIGTASIAVGESVRAIGGSSAAFGIQTASRGMASFSTGYLSLAQGLFSVAFGENTRAIGENSFVAGAFNQAIGNQSIALGNGTLAQGENATAFGNANKAIGAESLAAGRISEAVGTNSVALGYSAIAQGEYSTAFGYSTRANGSYATVLGQSSVADGAYSLATGGSTAATGIYSSSFGNETIAKAVGAVAVGTWNNNADNPNTAAPNPADRIFQIGNGSSGLRSNAVTILRNGNIGLGAVVNPAAHLHFPTDTRNRKIVLWTVEDNDHRFYGFGVNAFTQRYQVPATTDGHVFYAGTSATSSNELFRVQGNGNVGINQSNPQVPLHFATALGKKISLYRGPLGDAGFGVWGNELRIHSDYNGADITFGFDDFTNGFTERFRVRANGNATLAGVLTQNSDETLKKNIEPIANASHLLQQLHGYRYQWKDENADAEKQLGLLAQEVQKVLPELVKQNDNGKLGVNYSGLIPVLLEALKEQQAAIVDLKKRLDLMELNKQQK